VVINTFIFHHMKLHPILRIIASSLTAPKSWLAEVTLTNPFIDFLESMNILGKSVKLTGLSSPYIHDGGSNSWNSYSSPYIHDAADNGIVNLRTAGFRP
jgi:hypothetical protein